MPRVLLVVVAFAAAATALPHQLRRAKPEKSVADAHAPTRRMPSLAALEADIEELAASMEKMEDGSMDGYQISSGDAPWHSLSSKKIEDLHA